MPNTLETVAPVAPLWNPRKKLKKVALDTLTSPQAVKELSPRELLFMHLRVHQLFAGLFEGNQKTSAGQLTRERLLQLHQWLAEEMMARGYKHKPGDIPLTKAARQALIVPAPHGQMLLRGSQRMFLHKKFLKPGPFVVVEEDPRLPKSRLALGEIALYWPVKLKRQELDQFQKLHRLSPSELKPFESGAYAYGVEVLRAYPKPRPTHLNDRKLVKADSDSVIAFLFDLHGRVLVQHAKNVWAPPMGRVGQQWPEAAAYALVAQTGLHPQPLGHLPPLQTRTGQVFPFVFMTEDTAPGFLSLSELAQHTPLVPPFSLFSAAQHILIEPTVDLVRAKDRPETLTPAELVETDRWLHVLDQTETDVHEILKHEMERRGIRHLAKSDFRMAELQDLHAAVPPEIVIVPEWASVSGSMVYAQDREPNDVDWIFRDPMPTQGALLKLARLTQARTGKPAHFSLEGSGPNWPSVPVYDLVARRRPKVEVRTVDEPAFAQEFYKADLPADPHDFQLFHPFAHYKAGNEFYPSTEADLFQWANNRFAKGETLAVQEKYDGMRMHIHFDRESHELKVFTESGRERSEVFPGLAQALETLARGTAKNFALDTEFVQWNEKEPLPRWEMTWMIVGREGPKVPVRINVHDLMWLNGQSLTGQPYTERMKRLDQLLPKLIKEGLFTFVAAPTRWVSNEAELQSAIAWARKEIDSEGAMVKDAAFLYSGARHPDIVKFKNIVEIDVAVIGWKKNPAPRPEGEKWTEAQAMAKLPEMLRLSRTYIFRVAIKDGSRWIPLESDRLLTSRDLHLHWNEAEQKWEGTDDPKLWTMAKGWPSRGEGEYAYANTYALAMADPPYPGEILTVAPMQFRPFKKKDGSTGYAWMFPKIRNTKERGSPPGELSRILTAFGANPSGRTGVQKDAEGAHADIMIALPIPRALGQTLHDVQKAIPNADLIPMRELHLTLASLGATDAPPVGANQLPRLLREFSSAHRPLEGKISGFGRFDGPQESILYASFDSPALPKFRQDLIDALAECNFQIPEGHGFSPHITLAHLPPSAPMPDLKLPTADGTLPEIALAWGTHWVTFGLGNGAIRHLEKQDYPSEEKVHPFVIQNHYRGRSVHSDLRLEFNGYLVGWTIMTANPGAIQSPVLTLAQAKAEDRKASNWKIDWEKGEIRPREIRGGIVRRGNLRVEAKAKEIPADWLSVEGVTTKAEPGERPPTGATKNFPGVFSIVDKGVVEYGAQKVWAKEYFLHGRRLKGRWIVRLLTRVEQADPLPPGVVDTSRRENDYWVLMQPLDQTPYVLSEEAVQKDWLPPKGISALPKKMRDAIPPQWRYWTMTGTDALAARRDLATHFEEIGGPTLKTDTLAIVDFEPLGYST